MRKLAEDVGKCAKNYGSDIIDLKTGARTIQDTPKKPCMDLLSIFWSFERLEKDLVDRGLEGLSERLRDIRTILAKKIEEEAVEATRERVKRWMTAS